MDKKEKTSPIKALRLELRHEAKNPNERLFMRKATDWSNPLV